MKWLKPMHNENRAGSGPEKAGNTMRLTMCKCKLHRLTVTQAELHYEGSITIDQELLEAAGILPFEKVQVVDIDNGERFETYTYAGRPGSRTVCLNGAAARKVHMGDRIIVIAYCSLEAEEARAHMPRLVLVDEHNAIKEIVHDIPQPVLSEHDHEC
jgi:aspartate 1-decarboxylase